MGKATAVVGECRVTCVREEEEEEDEKELSFNRMSVIRNWRREKGV